MKSNLTIFVSSQNILAGVRNSHDWCPIANAIRTQIPNVTDVNVGLRVTTVKKVDEVGNFITETYDNPSKAETFIKSFDAGYTVKPAVFTLKAR